MPSRTLTRRPAVLLALGLCAFGGVVTLLGRLASGPAVDQKRVPLTTDAGTQSYPSFSPDGAQVAYSGQNQGEESFHVFVRPVAGGAARQLTTGTGSDIGPVWAPDGSTLAFLRVEEGRAQAMLIPAAGGAERKLAEFDAAGEDSVPSPSLSWTKDGGSLAVAVGEAKKPSAISMLSVGTGALRRITNPPEGSQGDGNPAVSPDGKALAFIRKLDEDRDDIYLCDLNGGGLRQLTFDNHLIRGLAWSIAGQDVVYGSERGPGWRLWRLPAYGGSPRDVLMAGTHASYPAIAAKGYRLSFTDSANVSAIWRARLGSPDDPEERQVIRSSGRESGASISPDGSKIADISEQSGTPQIWVGATEGGDRVQVTRFDGARIRNPRWSPDGGTILFETRGQNGAAIYTVSSSGGKVTRVVSDAEDASWSRDGKYIYYSANGQVCRASATGADVKQITRRFGSGAPEESVDGKWIYYRSRRSIWRVPVEGGKEEEVIVPDYDLLWAPMRVTKEGVYFSEFDRGHRAMVLTFYDFASGKSHAALRIKNGDFGDGFSLSPDGKSVLYSKTDRSQTNLMLIENFR